MLINRICMYLLSFGVFLGGMDRILGNRYGFGAKFEDGFRLLGPVGLSMAGIYCMAPLLSSVMEVLVVPLCGLIGIDPGVFGSILAIDMGGYHLSMSLAQNLQIGRWAGIIVAATFGCTVVFTIPVGLETIREGDRPWFIRGILMGFLALPVTVFVGGMACGMKPGVLLWSSSPILLICLLLGIGVLKKPEAMIRGFRGFSRFIRILATTGLSLAAISHISGITILKDMPPLQDAMAVVSGIGIVMLGSMPLAELIQRLMKRPFRWIQDHTGLNSASTTALLLGLVSGTPVLAMIPQMDRRGKVVSAACLVSHIGMFGAHLAFVMNTEPEMLPALMAAKLSGAVLAIGIALFATRRLPVCPGE